MGQSIIFLSFGSFYLLFFLACSQPLQIGCLPYFHTWCGLSENLECRSETCCTRLAENTGHKKIAKNSPSAHHRTICRAVYSPLRHALIGKKTRLTAISPTCPHNMVNFGPLAAEICWRVLGTPANFNGIRLLAALLHGTLVVGVSQTLRRWTEGATYIRQGDHHVGHIIRPHSSY